MSYKITGKKADIIPKAAYLKYMGFVMEGITKDTSSTYSVSFEEDESFRDFMSDYDFTARVNPRAFAEVENEIRRHFRELK